MHRTMSVDKHITWDIFLMYCFFVRTVLVTFYDDQPFVLVYLIHFTLCFSENVMLSSCPAIGKTLASIIKLMMRDGVHANLCQLDAQIEKLTLVSFPNIFVCLFEFLVKYVLDITVLCKRN